jgi:hypothetical protein
MNFPALTTLWTSSAVRRWHIPGELIDIMTVVIVPFCAAESPGIQCIERRKAAWQHPHWRAMNSAACQQPPLLMTSASRRMCGLRRGGTKVVIC